MTLAASIETNDGTVTLTGIVIALSPTYDPNAVQELWRAADSAGAPDSANAVRIAALAVPTGGFNYVDRLPTDGTIWWYRTRMTGGPYGDSTYGDWVNLGTAARLAKDGAVNLGVVSAAASSPAWTQATSRPGTHTQQMLPNAGFEDGLSFWLQLAGTATAINTAANANSGNWYLQLTSTTGVAAQVAAADDASRARYFEVNLGDVLQFGGFLYRESGTANIRYVLELTDKSKASATLYTTANQNTAAWVQVQGQQIVPAGKKYARVWAEIDATGTGAVARFDDVFLRIAFGASTIHNAQGSLIPNPSGIKWSYAGGGATTGHMWLNWTQFALATMYRADGSTIPIPNGTQPVPTVSLSQVAGGALGARTRFVRIALVKDHMLYMGSASNEQSLAVLANNLLKVTAPAAVAGYDGWAVLVGSAANAEFTQPGVTTALAFGSDWTEPVGGATIAGTTPYSTTWGGDGAHFGITAVELTASTTYLFYPCYDTTMAVAGWGIRFACAISSGPSTSADAASAGLQNMDGVYGLTLGAVSGATPAGGLTSSGSPGGSGNSGNNKYL